MSKTNIFVSSTCFDLKQIRRDLEYFITDLGHNPVLSDSKDIGIPAGLDNLDTCKWLVTNSDIFVLIIGGRIGSIDLDSGKSITNIEYDLAYELDIPIYTFVDNEVWNKRDTYYNLKQLLDIEQITEKDLKTALGPKIENPRVFEFIDRVSNAGRDQWIFPFNEAKDITRALRNNLSTLLKQCLLDNRKGKPSYHESKLKPIIRLSFLSKFKEPNQEQKTDTIAITPKQSLNQETILNNLRQLRPDNEIIELISRNAEEIEELIMETSPEHLGLIEEPEDIPRFIQSAAEFANTIDSLINLAKTDFERLDNYNFLMGRTVLSDFIVNNDGNIPADNIVIYINNTDKIKFMEWEQLKKSDLSLPYKTPKDVTALINITQNLDTLRNEPEIVSSKIKTNVFTHTDLGLFSRTGLYRGLTDFPTMPLIQEKSWSIFIQDERIRIDIERLKHEFQQKIHCDPDNGQDRDAGFFTVTKNF